MSYNKRSRVAGKIREEVKIALAETLEGILKKAAPFADDDEHRRTRVLQRYAAGALPSIETLSPLVALVVASTAPENQLDGGLDDMEIKRGVKKAVEALAAVELYAPTEVLPTAPAV